MILQVETNISQLGKLGKSTTQKCFAREGICDRSLEGIYCIVWIENILHNFLPSSLYMRLPNHLGKPMYQVAKPNPWLQISRKLDDQGKISAKGWVCWSSLHVPPAKIRGVPCHLLAAKISEPSNMRNKKIINNVNFATWIYISIQVFPKIMVPPNHPFVHRVFHYFHIHFGGPSLFLETSIHIPPWYPVANLTLLQQDDARTPHLAWIVEASVEADHLGWLAMFRPSAQSSA